MDYSSKIVGKPLGYLGTQRGDLLMFITKNARFQIISMKIELKKLSLNV
jgi:hypothetical protein